MAPYQVTFALFLVISVHTVTAVHLKNGKLHSDSQILPALDSPFPVNGPIKSLEKADRHWSNIPYLFESQTLPLQKHMPEVGNGHVATIVNGDKIFMNGLFNGLGPKSSRAIIPSLVGFGFTATATEPNTTYVLNVKEGIFNERRHYKTPNVVVHREIFAHREHDRLLVLRISVHRQNGETQGDAVTINLSNVPNQQSMSSVDLDFQPTVRVENEGKPYNMADGSNIITELPNTPKTIVTVAWTPIPESFTLAANEASTSLVVIFAASTLHTQAVSAIEAALSMTFEQLKESHVKKWDSYWSHGMIEVDAKENFPLAQAIYGSFYYLMSSLPNKQDPDNKFIGLSPGGLARGHNNTDYSGHVFWDMETWMYPPILYFHPDQAAIMLETRDRTLAAARANAILYGYKGVKYAWESAYSGNETSPWPQSGEWEIHITADVAFAIRQYLYLAPNKVEQIKKHNLRDIALGIAEFWQSRVECEADKCHIRVVMPPDEHHFPVNDSIYTNYAAKISLELPAYILGLLGETHESLPLWKKTAESLVMLTGTKYGRPIHLEFEDFEPGVLNPAVNPVINKPIVKQADVILLGFPFDKQMTPELRKNDLDIYLNVTDVEGPAMTWGMFSVGYLELGEKEEADRLFNKNFENVVEPFGIWSEIPHGDGALNFITGMGGFLQAIVNGYGGLRLHENHIVFEPHQLPNTTKWSIHAFKYLDNEIDLSFDFTGSSTNMRVTDRRGEKGARLVVVRKSGEIHDVDNKSVLIPTEKIVIREYKSGDKFSNSGLRFTAFSLTSFISLLTVVCNVLRF